MNWSLVLDWNGTAECLLLEWMLFRVFPRKRRTPECAVILLVISALYLVCHIPVSALLAAGNLSVQVGYWIYVAFVTAFSSAYGALCAKGDFRQRLVTTLFFFNDVQIASILIDSIITLLYPQSGIAGTILRYLVVLALAEVYRRITRTFTETLSTAYWVTACLTPLIICGLVFLWYGTHTAGELLFYGILLLAEDFIVYFLIMKLARELTAQMELKLTNQTLLFETRQMTNMEALLENTRTARHELKNNYFLLDTLAQEGRYDELREQLHKVILPALERDEAIATGNRFVDMLLTQKLSEARQAKVPITLNVLLPAKLELSQSMLCSLIFNLLDNAIEASASVAEASVYFAMEETKGYLKIEVRNKLEHSVLEGNPNLKTSKARKEEHGVGVSVIRKIVERCDGNVRFYEESGQFVVSILLPNRRETI